MKYWASLNKVNFNYGPYDSRAEAYGAMVAACKEMPERIYTGEEIQITVGVNTENLLEAIRKAFKLDGDWALLPEEADEELNEAINGVLLAWLKRWDVQTTFIKIDKVVAHTGGVNT